jgi:ubiquinone/menaquinone biosynthesis C-methylase UbiE
MRSCEKKMKRMGDVSFKCMTWMYKIADFVHLANPGKHLDKAGLEEGMVVVDYGCGPGRYAIPAAERVGPRGRVFAVDIQPLAIQMVKQKAARKSLGNIQTILVDSHRTPIETSSADRVLLIDTLHLIDNCEGLLHEVRRLLRPGGTLFMDPGHMKLSQARAIVESTGLFTLTQCFGSDMVVVPRATTGQSPARGEEYEEPGPGSHPGSAVDMGDASAEHRADIGECEQ